MNEICKVNLNNNQQIIHRFTTVVNDKFESFFSQRIFANVFYLGVFIKKNKTFIGCYDASCDKVNFVNINFSTPILSSHAYIYNNGKIKILSYGDKPTCEIKELSIRMNRVEKEIDESLNACMDVKVLSQIIKDYLCSDVNTENYHYGSFQDDVGHGPKTLINTKSNIKPFVSSVKPFWGEKFLTRIKNDYDDHRFFSTNNDDYLGFTGTRPKLPSVMLSITITLVFYNLFNSLFHNNLLTAPDTR